MKVLIIDIDSRIPNLALKKVEKYHLDRGDSVIWNNELFRTTADKIYVSCIYDWNKSKCREWEGIAEIGGSGYDLVKTLPSEIEKVKPRINIGFTTRGCIRQCLFCVVFKKEGEIRIEGDIYDIWDGKSKAIELLDNNIMALPKHFEKIWDQIKKEKLKVRENGLDIRLLNIQKAKILKSVKHYEYHFAFDNMIDEKKVIKGIQILQKVGITKSCFYVLVGFNTTTQQDLYRINLIRRFKQNAYVQRYTYTKSTLFHTALARWVNQHHIFNAMTWEQFIDRPENKRYQNFIKDEKQKN